MATAHDLRLDHTSLGFVCHNCGLYISYTDKINQSYDKSCPSALGGAAQALVQATPTTERARLEQYFDEKIAEFRNTLSAKFPLEAKLFVDDYYVLTNGAPRQAMLLVSPWGTVTATPSPARGLVLKDVDGQVFCASGLPRRIMDEAQSVIVNYPKEVCKCPIKNLLSTGHDAGCQERK